MIGVNQLIQRWDDLMALFGNKKVETKAQEMERLAKATSLTAEEQRRLNKLKVDAADQAAHDKDMAKLGGIRTEQERAMGQSVETAIGRTPGGSDAILKSYLDQWLDARVKAGQATNRAQYGHAQNYFKDMLGAADRGMKSARDELLSITKGMAGAAGEFRDALARHSPEAVGVRKAETEYEKQKAEDTVKAGKAMATALAEADRFLEAVEKREEADAKREAAEAEADRIRRGFAPAGKPGHVARAPGSSPRPTAWDSSRRPSACPTRCPPARRWPSHR